MEMGDLAALLSQTLNAQLSVFTNRVTTLETVVAKHEGHLGEVDVRLRGNEAATAENTKEIKELKAELDELMRGYEEIDISDA